MQGHVTRLIVGNNHGGQTIRRSLRVECSTGLNLSLNVSHVLKDLLFNADHGAILSDNVEALLVVALIVTIVERNLNRACLRVFRSNTLINNQVSLLAGHPDTNQAGGELVDKSHIALSNLVRVLAVGGAILNHCARVLDVAHNRGACDTVHSGGDSTRGVGGRRLTTGQVGGIGGNLTSVAMLGISRLQAKGFPLADKRSGLLINNRVIREVDQYLTVLQDAKVKANATILSHCYPLSKDIKITTPTFEVDKEKCADLCSRRRLEEKLADTDRQTHRRHKPSWLIRRARPKELRVRPRHTKTNPSNSLGQSRVKTPPIATNHHMVRPVHADLHEVTRMRGIINFLHVTTDHDG
nr:MAG TPA: hypothetical protein [Caudoviricetes sp.]